MTPTSHGSEPVSAKKAEGESPAAVAAGGGVAGGRGERLERLTKRLGGAGRRGAPDELREFWRLYRAATARLAELQAEGRRGAEEASLNRLVGQAHAVLYRKRSERSAVRRLAAFFVRGWPRVFRRRARLVGAAAGLFAVGMGIGAFYAARDPGFVALVTPPELVASIERGEMWTSGILSVKPTATSAIFSNNLTVAIVTFALGVTAGLGTAWVLVSNGVSLGAIAWVTARHDMAGDFWGFVVAHGVLELPAIFVAAAAGWVLAGGMLRPGTQTRSRALARAGGEALRLFLGCAPLLLVAAAIEGWFSPEPFPLGVKLAGGAVAAAALVGWVTAGGRSS